MNVGRFLARRPVSHDPTSMVRNWVARKERPYIHELHFLAAAFTLLTQISDDRTFNHILFFFRAS